MIEAFWKRRKTELEEKAKAASGGKRADRWLERLVITVGLNWMSAVVFPQISMWELTWEVLIICTVPVVWGFYSFVTYRTFPERVICYAAVFAAFYWVLAAFGEISVLNWKW